MLSFRFLGAPQLEKNNRSIELDTRKAIALAAYLALTQTAHQRDELAAFFYPEADSPRARAALRRTLSSLKTALGESVLEVERETIALNLERVRVDVIEFRELSRRKDEASLARAAQLYRGDFLAGFTLRDSPAFDEWQFFETESLRKQLAAVLEPLVGFRQAQRAYKHAIEYARRWLALDPLHEPAHRDLMLLYARDGQRAAALRQYHECVRQLEQELGVAPLPETTELYHAIQENRLPPETPALKEGHREAVQPPPFAPILPPYPLVGRARELELILGTFERVSDSGQLVVIQGEAGIGKTRLAQEAIETLAGRGLSILSARSYAEQHALAYAPFVQALREALNGPLPAEPLASLAPTILADAARLVPEIAPELSVPLPDGPGAQSHFFEAVSQVILALTRTGTMTPREGNPARDTPGTKPAPTTRPSQGVLFLDDAQWLDDASLDLLAYLVRRLKTAPLMILVTWRGEEVGGDHPLRRMYADALREERAQLIRLWHLERDQAEALIQVAAQRGAPIDARLGERLYRESEGQPFFLIETLKLLEREGHLPADGALPASVRALLQSRVARAGEAARQLLSTAAVIGHSFDFEILRAASGRSEDEAIEGLEELEANGLIVPVAGSGMPQYDFTHEKLRVLVYEETSLARRRLLHRRIAETMTQRPHTNLDASAARIAQHYRAGGDEPRAAEFYKRAGDYARSVFANREALENYTAALALGFPDAAALHTRIGDVETLLGAYDVALTAYETSAAFGAAGAEANIGRVYLRRGEWERAAQHLQNALKGTEESAVQARLYAELALAEHHSRHAADALRNAEHALKLAKKGKDQQALAQGHNILGILARTRGEWDVARMHLEASLTLAETMHDVGAHAAALNNLSLVYHATHDEPRALELAQRALELVTRAGDRHRQAALHNHLADLYHALGRDQDSMAHLKQAVAIYAEIGGEAGAWQPEIWKLEEW